MSKEHFIKPLRRASVPLVGVETSDPAQTMQSCVAALEGPEVAAVAWDVMGGHVALNDPGKRVQTAICKGELLQDPSVFLDEVLKAANTTTRIDGKEVSKMLDSVVFVQNGHRYLGGDTYVQALWNLRDVLKRCGCTLVLLGPSFVLPPELQHDFVVVADPLPDAAEVGGIVDKTLKDAGLSKVEVSKSKAVDILLGLSAFGAEQSLATSLSAKGVDMGMLWERKRKMVEQTPGLSVFRGGETFEQVGGLANVKGFLSKVLTSGRSPVRTVIFVDEIDKAMAGARGDLSGVSQDQLSVFLKQMQDGDIPGLLLIGPAGTGKSALAKGAGAVAGAEVVAMDMGAMTGSLVGESQAKIRQAWKVVAAISQGKAIVIATCNRIAALPPELRRRFKLGTFFMDTPTRAEREAIWKIHMARHGFDYGTELRPEDEGWTGAEIEACCDVAVRTASSLIEAERYVVPVCKSAAEELDALRRMADGRFLSASEPGFYKYEGGGKLPSGRLIKVEQTTTATIQHDEQKDEQ